MTEEKKSFIVYCDLEEILNELSDEDAGILFKAMVDYAQNGTEPELGVPLKYVWIPIRQQMDRDEEKWQGIKKARSAAGKKGGAKIGNQNASKSKKSAKVLQESGKRVTKNKQNKQSQAKQAVNVNVNDNVNVNVNDNVIQFSSDLLGPLEGAVGHEFEQNREEIYRLVAKRLDEGRTKEELRSVVQYQVDEIEKSSDEMRGNVEFFANPIILFGDGYESPLDVMKKNEAKNEKMEQLRAIEEETV